VAVDGLVRQDRVMAGAVIYGAASVTSSNYGERELDRMSGR
jgi:hypothetical protein